MSFTWTWLGTLRSNPVTSSFPCFRRRCWDLFRFRGWRNIAWYPNCCRPHSQFCAVISWDLSSRCPYSRDRTSPVGIVWCLFWVSSRKPFCLLNLLETRSCYLWESLTRRALSRKPWCFRLPVLRPEHNATCHQRTRGNWVTSFGGTYKGVSLN